MLACWLKKTKHLMRSLSAAGHSFTVFCSNFLSDGELALFSIQYVNKSVFYIYIKEKRELFLHITYPYMH